MNFVNETFYRRIRYKNIIHMELVNYNIKRVSYPKKNYKNFISDSTLSNKLQVCNFKHY